MKKTNKEKIIIIGGGISGLSAGIYGQRNGYDTEIYEKNPNLGGLCSSWKRDGMNIDGCIHWMTGTKKGTEIRLMWDELEAFKDEDIIRADNFGSIEYEGTTITFWCDLKRLEKELLEISPKDKKYIKRMIFMIYKIQNMPLPTDIPLSAMSLKRKLKFVLTVFPYLKMYVYTKKMQRGDYAKKFKSPALRYAFENIVPGDGNLYSTLYAYGTVALGNGGVLKGGSSRLISNMVDKYKNEGGVINRAKEIKRIIIENKTAVGVELNDGEIVKADHIISACDIVETYRLLNYEYTIKGFDKRLRNPVNYPIPSCVYISFKINLKEYEKLGKSNVFLFKTPSYMVGKREQNVIPLRVYSYDPNFIVGDDVLGTVLIHQSENDYRYWQELYKKPEQYKNEKERIGQMVLNRIEEKFPSLKGRISLIDVCTPITYNRYTNSYCGSYMPFAYTSKGTIYYSNGKIPGIKNLKLAGQWMVMPGGVPIAMMSGKFAIQRILKESHKWYKISKPVRFIYQK